MKQSPHSSTLVKKGSDVSLKYISRLATTQKVDTFANSETGKLRSVIIGRSDNFHANPTGVEVVNLSQAHYYVDEGQKPRPETLLPEFGAFESALCGEGVSVLTPDACAVPDQLTPRDIGFVIGKVFFIAGMARQSRKNEFHGILQFIAGMDEVIQVPEDIVLEGGDVIVDKGKVFVGISQRTNQRGVDFLKDAVGNDFEVIPVPLKRIEEDEDCLHLDCAFVPVGSDHALIYPAGFQAVPDAVRETYQWLEVKKSEQKQLGTNVLSLSPSVLISRSIVGRINALIRDVGIAVIEVKFDEAPKTGGSFRCCSLPLCRD